MGQTHEDDLRYRLAVLREEVAAGRVVFGPEVATGMKESLLAVRTSRDGLIDLATVDGRVRALALAVGAGKYRQDLKSTISLQELNQRYFEQIEKIFGNLHRQMLKARTAPHQVARAMSKDPEAVPKIVTVIPPLLDWIGELWGAAHEIARTHVEDMGGFKAVFGGELFPTKSHSIASTCGLYVDTIVLPEPFLRAKLFLTDGANEQKVYWLVKQALSLLNYKALASAELDVPIVAFVPDKHHFDQDATDFLIASSIPDMLAHLGALFDREFGTQEEAEEFLDQFQTPSDVVAGLKDPSRLLFEVGVTESLEQQLQEYIDGYLKPRGVEHAGQALFIKIESRMRQANDLLIRSRGLLGSPLIDAPVSWQYFTWKLQYDASRFNPEDMLRLHMVRGLQSATSTEMVWLGDVPAEALIEIRKSGALPELREILSRGVAEIATARPDNFFRTGDKVVDNIQAAFDEHKKQLEKLRGKKWRFAGIELGACVVRGAVAVAAACGVPFVSLINSALNETTDATKMKDLPAKYRSLRDESRNLRQSPVGLLFQHSQD
jgi:hypothetical protein